jgi:hypothetical protein
MIIVVEGTKSFDNYEVFMRAMGVALSKPISENEIQVWSLGPHKVNSFTASFCNSSESFLKNKGYKINFYKVNSSWVAENISNISYYAFFSLPKENQSKMCKLAQEIDGCEVGIFRY